MPDLKCLSRNICPSNKYSYSDPCSRDSVGKRNPDLGELEQTRWSPGLEDSVDLYLLTHLNFSYRSELGLTALTHVRSHVSPVSGHLSAHVEPLLTS